MHLSILSGKSLRILVAFSCLIAFSTASFATEGSAVQIQTSASTIQILSTGTASITVSGTAPNGAVVSGSGTEFAVAIKSGLPLGVRASWSVPAVSGAGVKWKLVLTGSTAAKAASTTLVVAVSYRDSAKKITATSTRNIAMSVTAVSPTISFAPDQTHITVVQGTKITDRFALTSTGTFSSSPVLAISSLPAGVEASWSSGTVAMTTGKGASTLTLATTVGVPARAYPFTVTATADKVSVVHTYTLTVTPTAGLQIGTPLPLSMSSLGSASTMIAATLMSGVSPASKGTGCAAQITSSLPSGVTATWSDASIKTAGEIDWVLTLTGSTTAVGWSGSVPVSVQVMDAATGAIFTRSQHVPLTIKFVPPALSVTPATTSIFIGQGGNATDVFSFAGGGSYHGDVTLAVSGLPSGLVANWSHNPVVLNSDAGTSILTLTADPALPVKPYSLAISATGDGKTVWMYPRVTIEPQVGVSLNAAQSTVRVVPGVAATMNVTAQALYNVTFDASGLGVQAQVSSPLPNGVTAQWSAPVITKSGKLATWQLSLNSTSGASSGIYPVTISSRVTDQTSGMSFSASQPFDLYSSLLGQVTVGATQGPSIAPEFMGLSQEWGNNYRFMGSNKVGVNQVYRQLLLNLAAYGSDPISLRIGGNSTDLSGVPSAGTDAPLADLASAMHNRFILGVNLGSDDLLLAEAQVANDLAQMPSGSIAALEIGNEPDLYVKNNLRSSGYSFATYESDFATWRAGINPLIAAGLKLSAPAWGSTGSWVSNLPSFLAAESQSISVVTAHYYATNPYANAPLDVLLQPRVSTQGPEAVATSVTLAHASGLKFRVDELGAVSNQGIDGVSDAFSSALWAIDTMFEYANVGVDGVNWETSSGNSNHPFFFETSTTNGSTTYTLTSVSPLYYGMLFFQQATANRAAVLPCNLSTTANLKCWPTLDAQGTSRLVLLNKDETQAGSVIVSMPGYTLATITRLAAPTYSSTAGTTLGGQTFDTTVDGTIQGTPSIETVQGSNGSFSIDMPITSAALVVFSN